MSSDENNESNDYGCDIQTAGARFKKSEPPRVAKKSTAIALSSSASKAAASVTRRQTRSLQREASDNFLDNFDPDMSVRERRKLNRKIAGSRRTAGALYDENGRHIATGLDMCDCLSLNCPGCHFPCPKCKSPKCGPDCRVNRKFTYDQIEYHGSDLIIKNPLND